MVLEKLCGGCAGVIAGPILNQDNVLSRLLENARQKISVGLRIKPSSLTLIEKLTGAIVNQAKDLVGFALATGGTGRLLSFEAPGVTL